MINLISIIIPCYNDAEYIGQAVNSALFQSYPNIEVIVVDDGSNPETKKVLEKLNPKIDLLITQDNQGQSKARNIGIKMSKGEYILTLDSDDYLETDFCKEASSLIESSIVRMVSCHTRCFNAKREWIFKSKGGYLKDFLFESASLNNILFRYKDWKTVGGYDDNMIDGWEDWEFSLRLLKLGGKCEIIPEVLFNYRKRSDSTTSRANANRLKLWRYLLKKHKDLYISNYEDFVDFFLDKIEREEFEKNKNKNRIEFKIGYNLLKPIRFLKKKIS